MHMDFGTVSTPQYRNRSLTKQVEAFKSGEKYIQMEAAYKELLRFHHQEVKKLEYELSKAHGETVTEKVCIRLGVEVIEYTAKQYRNRKTGARVHAPFPEGFVNEVNDDGTVKALAFLPGNECCVSHGKIRRLLSELTEGRIEISDGMINGLCAEFSAKTEQEKKELLKKLLSSPVMNVDFTNASVNGKGMQVLVLASPSEHAALYIGREKKGHAGGIGTPLQDYVGTVVHDHDKTFYSYGTGHQERGRQAAWNASARCRPGFGGRTFRPFPSQYAYTRRRCFWAGMWQATPQ